MQEDRYFDDGSIPDWDQDAISETLSGESEFSTLEDSEDFPRHLARVQECESCSFFESGEVCTRCRHYKGCTLSGCAKCV